jgi:hypothetical protein
MYESCSDELLGFDEKLVTRRGWHRAKIVEPCGSSSQLISTAPNQRWDFSLPQKASTVPHQHEV